MSMERLFPRCFLAFCLLGLTALLAASCASSSDNAATENTSTTQTQPAASDTLLRSDSANTESTVSTSAASTSETPQSTQPEPSENQNTEGGDADISSSSRESSSLENTTPTNKATAVSTNYQHSCALHEDGTISCWGSNRNGQLGNGQSGYEANSSVPVLVEGITDAKAVTAGGEHSCAVHEDGAISCWGNNYDGQLGNGQGGEDVFSSIPVSVAGITDAEAVSAGWDYSCALHQDGTVSCWGHSFTGQLGGTHDEEFQAEIEELIEEAEQPGASSTLTEELLRLRLQVYAQAYALVPVRIEGITDATFIVSNSRHSCALREGGTISCWGNNRSGQLGNRKSRDDGAEPHSSVPVEVAGITDATAIAAGKDHSCAVHRSGTVSCWGNNYDGQLGNGQSQDYENRSVENRYGPYSYMPTGVAGITDAVAISAGGEHSCAVHRTGAISCWGNNWHGQLGNGQGGTDDAGFAEIANDFYSPLPVSVVGITDATAITTGLLHTCALHRTGAVSCWGDTGYGQLGNGQSGYIYASAVPLAVVGVADATAIATIWEHSCALHEGGTVSCWGKNIRGQLGNGQSGDRVVSSVPVRVAGITDATAITAGFEHSCALHEGGTISCWGDNYLGQLGNGQSGENAMSSVIPVQVADITNATAISIGGGHSCALHRTGAISCWGSNWYGQLGNGQSGENADSSVPVKVKGITDATAISAGFVLSCALHQDGTISCWGNNEYGQLGNGQSGENADSSVPVRVADITDATAISAGHEHSCALHRTGAISCWGYNWYGQLGNGQSGENADSSVPVRVADITDATATTRSGLHSCALRQDGRISCWGIRESGRLGDGKGGFETSGPVEVIGITDATGIITGSSHSCALHLTGAISCWGNNEFGQLGNGVWLPRPVIGFGG